MRKIKLLLLVLALFTGIISIFISMWMSSSSSVVQAAGVSVKFEQTAGSITRTLLSSPARDANKKLPQDITTDFFIHVLKDQKAEAIKLWHDDNWVLRDKQPAGFDSYYDTLRLQLLASDKVQVFYPTHDVSGVYKVSYLLTSNGKEMDRGMFHVIQRLDVFQVQEIWKLTRLNHW